MNYISHARMGYSSAAAPIRTPRAIEYDAFARVTARLRRIAESTSFRVAELAEALHENRRLWTVLAGNVADPENALPPELRARLFYLAEFTLHHSSKILAGKARPDVLVDINMAVMRGLRQQADAA